MPRDMGADHILERRSHLLAERLVARKEILRDALAPRGQRPPFKQQLSVPAALKFWQQHRYDDIGRKVLSYLDPASVMELDQALAQQAEADMYQGSEPDQELEGGDSYG